MKKIYSHILRLVAVSFIVFTSLFLFSFDNNKNFESAKQLDIFYSIFQELQTYYVDDVDPGELMNYAIDRMLEALDPYTKYIPESDVERFQMMTKGEYGGIGALIGARDSVMFISQVFEGYPAHKAGLLPGDKIVSIDDRSIIGKDREELHDALQGQPGTSIKLGIIRNEDKKVLSFILQRQNITLKSVPYYGMLNTKTGYIKLTGFTQDCSKEVKTALISLKNSGAEGIILDLRDNPGGLLIEAVEITNLFVDRGKKIVFTKGKNSIAESSFYTKEQPLDTKIPLVVIVNEHSASASEIVSGALQDLDRAVIIGKQTFGKGLVQTRRDVAHNSLLKITTSKYYIPSGRCIQKMDYSQHFKNSKGAKISESKSVYYTVNKRPVKDAGGILPDVFVATDSVSHFLQYLDNDYVIEDYVNKYYSYSDTVTIKPETFILTDVEYKKFVDFTLKSKANYISPSEELLVEVEKQLNEEKITYGIKLADIKTEINNQQKIYYDTYKKQIKTLVKEAIITRLYFEKGKIKSQITNDDFIELAKKYTENSYLYNDIIDGKSGEHKK